MIYINKEAFSSFINVMLQTDARAALAANNYELKNRRIAVTLTDTRVRGKNKYVSRKTVENASFTVSPVSREMTESGLGRRAEARNRSVRVRNLPAGTQEGLLHQFLEKHTLVKRTEIFTALNEAIVELENPAVSLCYYGSVSSFADRILRS